MKEKLVSFRTAKLAKEKGFDICQLGFYLRCELIIESPIKNRRFGEPLKDITEAPTQSLLQKWLREKHDIHVDVIVHYNPYELGDKKFYELLLPHKGNDFSAFLENTLKRLGKDAIEYYHLFESYEQALEKGLQEALNLI